MPRTHPPDRCHARVRRAKRSFRLHPRRCGKNRPGKRENLGGGEEQSPSVCGKRPLGGSHRTVEDDGGAQKWSCGRERWSQRRPMQGVKTAGAGGSVQLRT